MDMEVTDFNAELDRIVAHWHKLMEEKGINEKDILSYALDLAGAQQRSVQRMAIQQHKKHGYEDISSDDAELDLTSALDGLDIARPGRDAKEVLRLTLEEIPVAAIFQKHKITTLDSKDSPYTALEKLARRGVLSAPVVAHHKTKPHVVLGLLDILGIVQWMLGLLKSPKAKSLEKMFETTKLVDLSDSFTDWKSVSLDTPLLDLLDEFALGLHRVPVIDDKGKFIGIVSQSNVLKFFAQSKDLLEPFTSCAVKDVSTYRERKDIRAVTSSLQTYRAFDVLIKHNISAVAIVDEEDQLLGGFSATHMRGMDMGSFYLILKPVSLFVDVVRPDGKVYKLTCTPDLPLKSAMDMLCHRREHRIWTTARDGRLAGMLSLTDIVRHIVNALR